MFTVLSGSFGGLLHAFLFVRVLWLWGILECSSELVALLGGVVAVQMPRALLYQQVFEAAGGLLRVFFRRALVAATVLSGLRLRLGPE
jgi:hypothetical protein